MNNRRGFTLIELVVVILILGILAGVAAPKMFSASAEATDNGLRHTLSVVRDAIELYSAKNGGASPRFDTVPNFKEDLKPYLRGNFPTCPVGPTAAQDADVAFATGTTTTGDAAPTVGWKYNSDTREFICNNSNATASVSTVTYDQL
ncbi:competence type IV pilus major pilin ComGC [Adhaeretor mobilis]|uniref:Type II secretion system protein G n=1 Tax=Adhaeretor mobilis TaxID=1930276 RepID=A0A517MVP2_9BACT|nr:type II secretion system protein [Adhaeretor mobilis]QDS98941.1 Type II secretion system protein G precursor [Adhaeretor mobilis]